MSLPALAFFGLGALGAPLAGRLRQSGYALAAHDSRPEALAAHRQACGPDGAVADQASVWITCVTDQAAADALYFGPGGLLSRMPAGSIAVDHTTTSPAFARRAERALAARGVGFVDCPLSGGVAGAQAGRLLAMQGGARACVDPVAGILAAYCQRVVWFGAAGSGQAAKLANQLAIAGTVRGLHEAARFARACGLDVGQLLGALAAGSAHSAQMDQHAAKLAASAAGFGAHFGWIAKDLALAQAEFGAAESDPGLARWLLQQIEAEAG
jgi:3-hydroxyisobutyrate dehydrogenase-like beta-hydroxyacid dehydrogenase